MRNPVSGMNPYLEQPELWHQVHHRLIVAIADAITPQSFLDYTQPLKLSLSSEEVIWAAEILGN